MEKKDETCHGNGNTNRCLVVIILTLIIIIILLLMKSCGNKSPDNGSKNQSPIGNFEISNQIKTNAETHVDKNAKITFAGYGKYYISEQAPNIELKNPENNFVDMVFTIIDSDTGSIIARTDKVPVGKFVYVNVMDFYKTTGSHDVKINTSTYDSNTGAEMNGMEQEVEITIK